MLKVTSIIKSKNAWDTEHIVNVCYASVESADESNELSALRGESFASPTRFKDGARLEGLASALFITETKDDGTPVKRSILSICSTDGKKNWDEMLEKVNDKLSGVIDPTAFGESVPASVIMNDETVIALIGKDGTEIPNVPIIYRGENGKEVAIQKQAARWKQRIAKGNATVKRQKTTTD